MAETRSLSKEFHFGESSKVVRFGALLLLLSILVSSLVCFPRYHFDVFSESEERSRVKGGHHHHHPESVAKQLVEDALLGEKMNENFNQSTLVSFRNQTQDSVLKTSLSKCNFYEGKWIQSTSNKKSFLYDNTNCPIIQSNWLCQNQKRSNFGYLDYEWKPNNCKLPTFNPVSFLKRMKNKVIAFIGDSLAQQQFKSLACMLSTNPLGSNRIDVTSKYQFSKSPDATEPNGLAYKFPQTNTVLILIGNALLCDLEDYVDENGNKRVAMHLDRPDSVLVKFFPSLDVVIAANGNHFNALKIRAGIRDYFLNGKKVKDQNSISVDQAANIIIRSMASFLNSKSRVKNKQGRFPLLFFRTISPSHDYSAKGYPGGRCDNIQQPLTVKQLSGLSLRDLMVENASKNGAVTVLNITFLSKLRGDAHIVGAVKIGSKIREDCRHWCLPGIPDVWNQILNAHLIAKGS